MRGDDLEEPPTDAQIIAGAIFDFAGFLTTRDKVIKVGSTANAAPVADLVKEWADMRKLSLDDVAVSWWQDVLEEPPKRKWVRLTDDEMMGELTQFARAIEAKLKEKNGF